MADFIGTTSSNDAKIKKGKEKELQAYIDKCVYGEAVPAIDKTENTLSIYGYDWFVPYTKDGDDSMDESIEAVSWFRGLAPFLAEPLVVQMIGATKCRFPLSAREIKVFPDGKVKTNEFRFV